MSLLSDLNLPSADETTRHFFMLSVNEIEAMYLKALALGQDRSSILFNLFVHDTEPPNFDVAIRQVELEAEDKTPVDLSVQDRLEFCQQVRGFYPCLAKMILCHPDQANTFPVVVMAGPRPADLIFWPAPEPN